MATERFTGETFRKLYAYALFSVRMKALFADALRQELETLNLVGYKSEEYVEGVEAAVQRCKERVEAYEKALDEYLDACAGRVNPPDPPEPRDAQ